MTDLKKIDITLEAKSLDKEYYSLLNTPITDGRNIHIKLLKKYDLDITSIQGWRSINEDEYIYKVNGNNILLAVFDGHGGDWVSNYCSKIYSKILFNTEEYKLGDYEKAFVVTNAIMDKQLYNEDVDVMYNYCKTDLSRRIFKYYQTLSEITYEDFHHSNQCGSTCCAVLITPNKIICSNIGDSKAILIRGRNIFPLNVEHKVSLHSEESRIFQTIYSVKNERINGILNVSRGFGDFEFKDMISYNKSLMGILSTPEIKTIPRLVGYDKIIIACDGLWDCYDEIDVRNYLEISEEYINTNGYESGFNMSMYNRKWFKNIKIYSKDEKEITKNLAESCVASEEDLLNEENDVGFDNITTIMFKC